MRLFARPQLLDESLVATVSLERGEPFQDALALDGVEPVVDRCLEQGQSLGRSTLLNVAGEVNLTGGRQGVLGPEAPLEGSECLTLHLLGFLNPTTAVQEPAQRRARPKG